MERKACGNEWIASRGRGTSPLVILILLVITFHFDVVNDDAYDFCMVPGHGKDLVPIDSCMDSPIFARSTPNSSTTRTSMSYPPSPDSETLTPLSDSFLEKIGQTLYDATSADAYDAGNGLSGKSNDSCNHAVIDSNGTEFA